jgi:hypothetical protein
VAVIVHTVVAGVDRDTHDRLEAAIGANIERAGGPPPGLMAHVGHPDGEDLVIVEVFGNEAGFQAWWTEVIAPAIAALDLTAGGHDVSPVWSFARP